MEWVRCTVVEFSPVRGGGKVRLENGDELWFDVSVADTREPEVGVSAKAVIGPGYDGRPRVKRLAAAPVSWQWKRYSVEDALRQMHDAELFRGWTARDLAAALAEIRKDAPPEDPPPDPGEDVGAEEIRQLAHGYYGAGLGERGRADRTFIEAGGRTHAESARRVVAEAMAIAGADGLLEIKLRNARSGELADSKRRTVRVRTCEGSDLFPAIDSLLAKNRVKGRLFGCRLSNEAAWWVVFRPVDFVSEDRKDLRSALFARFD